MASGLATLSQLQDEPPYAMLEDLAQRLAQGLTEAASRNGLTAHVARVGSMLTLFFHPGPVRNYAEATASDTRLFSKLFWKLMERGVYFPCSQFEAMFVSAAHTTDDIDQTIAAASESLAEIAAESR
jgi:glutamate-1-semialdehyde 2,1-aminomutase